MITEKEVNDLLKELDNNPDLCQYLLFHSSQFLTPHSESEFVLNAFNHIYKNKDNLANMKGVKRC